MKRYVRGLTGATGIALVAILVLVPGSRDGFAQGEPERSRETQSVALAASAVLGSELRDAVEIAADIPGDWQYDPASRFVFRDSDRIDYPLTLSDAEWRRLLDPTAYSILRQKGTEPAFSHPLNDNPARGIYYSRATGQPLFRSEDKYDSRTGWPSFTRPVNPDAIVYREDNSLFMRRIEVVDSLSGSHLGHVFPDGPAPTFQRYCINGAALIFVPEGGDPPPIPLTAGL